MLSIFYVSNFSFYLEWSGSILEGQDVSAFTIEERLHSGLSLLQGKNDTQYIVVKDSDILASMS